MATQVNYGVYMTNTVRVYGTGGAGTNLVKMIAREIDSNEVGAAKLVFTVADTSDANLYDLPANVKDVILNKGLDGKLVDGSGGVRSENVDLIRSSIGKIITDQPPCDFNLVVYSASGGSGGTIAAFLMNYFAKNNIPFMGVMVETFESGRHIDNTHSTYKTIDGMCRKSGTPWNIARYHCARLSEQKSIDQQIVTLVSLIAVAFSGDTLHVDNADLKSFLGWHVPTGRSVAPAILDVVFNVKEDIVKDTPPVSVLALYTNRDETMYEVPGTPYMTTGYLQPDMASQMTQGDKKVKSIIFTLSTHEMATAYSSVQDKVTEMETYENKNVDIKPIAQSDDADDDGFVC